MDLFQFISKLAKLPAYNFETNFNLFHINTEDKVL